ncbi:large ribosomal subunit protein bL21m [Euwallacea similis]|uniref:large ribosomal subunit protein bL21m n=1 Tax=Euwallacea similis TaxID=1736056 RepID=UPI00344ECF60
MANVLPGILRNFRKLSLKSLQNAFHQPIQPFYVNSAVSAIVRNNFSNQPTTYEVVSEDDYSIVKATLTKINTQVAQSKEGRLFAIVHISGKQQKITEGDVLIVEGYWPPECGDKISLNKVLVAGAADFTLIGRPLVQKGLVDVQATVIEKTLSHTKTHFRKKRRKQYMRTTFFRIPQTYLRINSIRICGEVGNPPEVQGLDKVIF